MNRRNIKVGRLLEKVANIWFMYITDFVYC